MQNNDTTRRQPPSGEFDRARPVPISNTSPPQGREVPAGEYRDGPLSKSDLSKTDPR
jgi:hypothetical protein